MRVAVALMVMLCVAGTGAIGQPAEAPKDDKPAAKAPLTPAALDRLHAGGQSWVDFQASIKKRADLWKKNTEVATVSDATVARLKAVPGSWRLLAVAIDQCSDSVNTIPFIAKLVEQVPSISMRIVNSTDGRAVMEAHRTPDGRAATPTVVLLNDKGAVAGCWIERPAKLRVMLDAEKAIEKAAAPTSHEGHGEHGAASGGEKKEASASAGGGGGEGGMSKKMEWYEQDKGGETVAEVVAMIEAAAAGRQACPYPPQ